MTRKKDNYKIRIYLKIKNYKIKNYSNTLYFLLFALIFSIPFLVRMSKFVGVCNERGAWGIVSDEKVLIFLSAVILGVVFYFFKNSQNKILKSGLGLVLLGGVSNLFERIYWGCVFDYFKVFSWYPAFNLGDCLVAFGMILLFLDSFRKK